MMVESEARELTEDEMLGAVMFAHEESRKVIGAIIQLAEQAAKEPWEIASSDGNSDMKEHIRSMIGDDIAAAYKLTDKSERSNALNEARAKVKAHYSSEAFDGQAKMTANKLTKKLEAEIVRGAIIKDGQRIDGRQVDEVRPIEAMVHLLPRTHGSALFTRGETQAICTVTLGTKDSEQMIDGLEGLSYQNFMLHYNFPPYSVGEVGRFGAPSRREIGHGKLAWRALHPLLPAHEDFPYTIRILSDITESNGSSSMATVCGGCLAMMDAGVPIARPVSGIAMGLILEGKDFAVLSDILGDEDHLGDMDFKVAGTEAGITSLQMDIKIAGITREIMAKALEQAKEGRAHILGEMTKALGTARSEVSEHAPRIETIQIDKTKIREVIGTGGKVIREIVAETGAKVDIDDEGRDQDLVERYQADRGCQGLDPGHRRGARGRQGLQRQGRQHRRFRRVRELHGRQGRSRPRLRDEERAGREARRRRQRGPGGQGQGARNRPARQGPPVDARGRPGDRRGTRGYPAGA